MSTDSTEFEEKYFENPTYDGTSVIRLHSAPRPGVYGVPVLPVAARQPQAFPGPTCDAVNTTSPKVAGKGQTYDVLDRGKINGNQNYTYSYRGRANDQNRLAFVLLKVLQSNHPLRIL